MNNILLILTGGTICSFENEKGEQTADTSKAKALIIQKFRESDSLYANEKVTAFDCKMPLNTLSENITAEDYKTLIAAIKSYNFSLYNGVIILHGTDTLAYTSALLSLVLANTEIPVILVSSFSPLYEKNTNGNENFKTAVELIAKGLTPNVYAVYQNVERINGNTCRKMYLHYASHLKQCENGSNNFYSADMCEIADNDTIPELKKASGKNMLCYDYSALCSFVLNIEPYPLIDYSRFSLKDIKAVLHHTYHSGTVAVNGNSKNSVLYLKQLCDNNEPHTELYFEGVNKNCSYLYETTGELLRNGVGTIFGTTKEMAYIKLLLGCAFGYTGKELQEFIHTEINGEFIIQS